MPTVIGVDLAAGRGVTAVAALEVSGAVDVLPRFDLTRHQAVQSDAEIVEATWCVQPVVVAIDAPLTLPAAVTAALAPSRLREGGASPAKLPLWSSGSPHSAGQTRTAPAPEGPILPETPAERSPYTRAAERDPLWGRLGLRPLPTSFLGGLTFRAIVLLPRLHARLPHASIIEVFPSATLRILGIRPPKPGDGRRAAKTSPAARATTQAGLRMHIAGLPQPEVNLLDADLLDALAAALTAAYHLRGATLAVGDPIEGQIILPRRNQAPLP
jgi:predicted nuclease with RNAse H fold